ncbi:MAG: LLM class flavin-dependent oxidoreductase [Actinomycetota bacterium]|nr:LLM class flavin-dependent oxidoreductase [Actinomycetota bacterium]
MALTSFFAPTVLAGPQLIEQTRGRNVAIRDESGSQLASRMVDPVVAAEAAGVDYALIAQRWWGSGTEIEGSSFDCLAMTAFYAARTSTIGLITAIHPGFFLPGPIAKWGTSIDRLTGGRWSINVTSGWNLIEFPMYGAELVEHDDRYRRSKEFIEILRGAWAAEEFSYDGEHYAVDQLRLEPRPTSTALTVFQGGQSDAARQMAAENSDWMFLNGGTPEKIGAIIDDVRDRAAALGRRVRFALFGIPLCRQTDAEAQSRIHDMVSGIDRSVAEQRRNYVSGAKGMWEASDDELTLLDTNEGYASRLIGSPNTVIRRLEEFIDAGVDCFHLSLSDRLFMEEVFPAIRPM